MAILRDLNYEDTQIEMELALDKYEKADQLKSLDGTLTFRFGNRFPEVKTSCCFLVISEVEELIAQLISLATQQLFYLEYEPLEPDFKMQVSHCGAGKYEEEDRYELTCFLDVRMMGYRGVGLSLVMDVERETVRKFAEDLRKELEAIRAKPNRAVSKKPPQYEDIYAAFITDMNDLKDRAFSVYLVNFSENRFLSGKILTGAFEEDVETSKAVFKFAGIDPGSYLKIDWGHRFMLDFVIWYEIDLINEDGETFKYNFSIPRSDCMNESKWSHIPFLNQRGLLITLKARWDEKSIDEIIETLDEKPKVFELQG